MTPPNRSLPLPAAALAVVLLLGAGALEAQTSKLPIPVKRRTDLTAPSPIKAPADLTDMRKPSLNTSRSGTGSVLTRDNVLNLNFKPNLGGLGNKPGASPAAPSLDNTGATVDAAKRGLIGMPQSPQAAASRKALEAASGGFSSFMSQTAAMTGSAANPAAALSAAQTSQAQTAASQAASRPGADRSGQSSGSSPRSSPLGGTVPLLSASPAPSSQAGAKLSADGSPIFASGPASGPTGGTDAAGQPGRAPRDPREVLLETSALLDDNPGDVKARTDRAEALVEVGDYEAAAAEATKVLETDPASIRALNARAYANNKRGQYAFALQDADLVVRLAPNNAMGHLNRAMALEGLGRLVEALQEYTLAAQLDPTFKTFLADAQARRESRLSSGAGSRDAWFFRGALGLFGFLLAALAAWGLRARRKAAAAKRAAGFNMRAGSVVGGNYRIDKLIGEGGMGKVFEGFDTAIRRKVAVKMMRAELRQKVGDAQILEEARLVALVRHPNVVEIFAALQEGGEIFLVFDFVAGRPLHALVQSKRRLSLPEARHILGQIAAGLDCAHTKRVIHRDLKPGNVVISNEGVAKLMDFGIAHRSGPGEQSSVAVSGTLPYMAPEQHEGAVSPESDLYALGVMAYEMLTGRRPFEGADELDRKRRMQFAPAVSFAPELPPSVDAALARVLAADPARRFHSGKEFVDALAA